MPAICNSFALCLQFQLAYKLPAICNSFALCLQLQLAYKLPTICNTLLFAYNFNWHIDCLQFFQSTCSLQHYNFNCHSNARNLQFVCSLPTISTGIQMPAICNSIALCLQLQLAYKLPAICNSFALCPQLQLAYKLPAICNPLLFAYNFNWHTNCLQVTIHLFFAYNYHFATRFSDLHLLRAQCLRKMNSEISQIICEPSHATNCILSARHALIFMVSLYSDLVQAFENVILTIYSETHLIT